MAPFVYSTGQFDNNRTGWNPRETVLTVANVAGSSFKLLFKQTIDGVVYAQPLYFEGLTIPGQGIHNVVVVATETNNLYLFDGDRAGPPLVHRLLLPPGELPVDSNDVGNPFPGGVNVAPTVGVTSTPVIDRTTNTLYVVATSRETSGARNFHFRLYALDLATLSDKFGGPVEIKSSFPGSIDFDPQKHLNRPALLQANGSVYIGFGSHADAMPYHGWLFAYDPATLQKKAVLNLSPDAGAAAIWQSGVGPAADSDGFIYLSTGNGGFTVPSGKKSYGNSVVKLSPDLRVVDFFTPCNQCHPSVSDSDLGSGGVLVVPDQPGPFPHLALACGKEGTIYVLDRDDLGKYHDPQDPGCTTNPATQYCVDNVLQTLFRTIGGAPTNSNEFRDALFGGPAYYSGPAGPHVYYAGNNDRLCAFPVNQTGLSQRIASQSPDKFELGATPVVSSNGALPGTGIVWVVQRGPGGLPLRLCAYDATDLKHKLFSGDIGPWTNNKGSPFLVPTVANGRVYVAISGLFTAFGLDPCQSLQEQVDQLSSQIQALQDALDSGEIPPPPSTPGKVDKIRAFILQLARQLARATAALDHCRESNPEV